MTDVAASIFCSIRASLGGEPLYGTAIRADQCVFISWPRPWWSSKPFSSRHFPEAVRDVVARIRNHTKTRFFLFDPPTRDLSQSRSLTVMCMPCGGVHRVPLNDLAEALQAYETSSCLCAIREADDHIGQSIFVCTHSNRDQCCAKFGYGFAKQVRLAADAANVSMRVFETSHLGGDRFAGTAILFPSGEMHGWLRPEDAVSFVDAVLHERTHASTYRGSIFLDRPQQVAEAYMRSALSAEFAHAPIKLEVETSAGVEQVVLAEIGGSDGPPECLEIVLRQRSYQAYSDCADLSQGLIGEAKRWIVDRWSRR